MDFWHTYKGVVQSGLMAAFIWTGVILLIVGEKKQSNQMRQIGLYFMAFAAGLGSAAFFR